MTYLSVFFCLFALLIGNAAGSLARGLARSLAFTAATVLCALFKIAGIECYYSLHDRSSEIYI